MCGRESESGRVGVWGVGVWVWSEWVGGDLVWDLGVVWVEGKREGGCWVSCEGGREGVQEGLEGRQ